MSPLCAVPTARCIRFPLGGLSETTDSFCHLEEALFKGKQDHPPSAHDLEHYNIRK